MKKSNVVLFAAAALVAAKGLDNRLEISHYRIKSDELPLEFDGFKIVHISDFHCDKTAGLIDAIRNEKPNIICATGDMAHDDGSYEPFINLLKAIIDIAPVYIVSGKANIDKVLELFDIEKDIDPVTVNGWFAEELKSLPTRGAKIKYENLNIEVIKMKSRRIESVKITVLPKEVIE